MTALQRSWAVSSFAEPPVHAMRMRSGRWAAWSARVRWWLSAPWRQSLTSALMIEPAWQALVLDNPLCLRPVMRCYVDRRVPLWRRPDWAAADFAAAGQHFSTRQKMDLAAGRESILVDLGEGFRLEMAFNSLYPEEGLWALRLVHGDATHVFQLTFSFLPHGRMLVGSVQGGASTETTPVPEVIKRFTKHFHGLRPQVFLVEALGVLAQRWRQSVSFVSPRYQAKSRWYRVPKGISFDYEALFRDCSMVPKGAGRWGLPLPMPRREMSDIDARKRAMYRRRYAWLDDVAQRLRVGSDV
ncbi:MAG: DUF535 family protein [Aquabacterium sp.]|uniref:DUF535 family protein n=1 Tax=Aquabacterium sp. TaxID=1872578 RepID=UPI003BDDC028